MPLKENAHLLLGKADQEEEQAVKVKLEVVDDLKQNERQPLTTDECDRFALALHSIGGPLGVTKNNR